MSFGLGVSPAVEAKQSPIEVRMKELDRLLDELRAVSAGFAVKLQGVLEPQMASGSANSQATPKPVVAPLVERLDCINAGLVHELSILRDIYNRIAV
jgi:hypothetical protein